MDQYITGKVIRFLREKNNMTQLQLAEKLGISDKTVSKWETGRGYPDITLLGSVSEAFGISINELISGNMVQNDNRSADMMRSRFYVCPICGNVVHSMGDAAVFCHGIQLMPLEQEVPDEDHRVSVELMEDEIHVFIEHNMSKEHYISFVAALSQEEIQMVKLYPEGKSEVHFRPEGVRRVLFYCNHDGLFGIDVIRKRNR